MLKFKSRAGRIPGLICHRLVFCFSIVIFFLVAESGFSISLPTPPFGPSGEWSLTGRTELQTNRNSVIITGGFAVSRQTWADAEISFQARAPLGADQVQIWGGFRCRGNGRDSRYVF